MNKDSVRRVLHEAGFQSPDWEKIAKLLELDCIVLPAVFFNQWSAVAGEYKLSWKVLSKALKKIQDPKYKQAAIKELEEGAYTVIV